MSLAAPDAAADPRDPLFRQDPATKDGGTADSPVEKTKTMHRSDPAELKRRTDALRPLA